MPSLTQPFTLFRLLLLPAIIAFLYLYFYPAINDCAFPPAKRTKRNCRITDDGLACKNATVNAGKAPFRLLALADPQLEGDSSLPANWDDESASLSRVWEDVKSGSVDWEKLGVLVQGYRKKVDLWGNDWYLAHVYAQTRWWASPSHTVVLGDLLGSQWIGDQEFERRAERFWGRVFAGREKVDELVMEGGGVQVLSDEGEAARAWRRKIIAVAGNHDVGYAGDLNEQRVERFERVFGRVNWEVKLRLPRSTERSEQIYGNPKGPDLYAGEGRQPEIRLVVLNSMNLDEPAYSAALREESLRFMEEEVCKPGNEHEATVLLTHVPLHKASGICTDGPFFSYFSPNNGGGVREQNHLSEDISRRLLDCLAATNSSIILNGHDHEGCDTQHYSVPSPPDADIRNAVRHSSLSSLLPDEKATAMREITVRSMMGSYGGYAGFLSGWFDEDKGKWEFEYETCGFGVQHIWWACNIVLLLEIGLGVMSALDAAAGKVFEQGRVKVKKA